MRVRDIASEVGLSLTTRTFGAIVFDYNNDGWPDIFLGRHDAAAFLYRNDHGHFVRDDSTEFPGTGRSAPVCGGRCQRRRPARHLLCRRRRLRRRTEEDPERTVDPAARRDVRERGRSPGPRRSLREGTRSRDARRERQRAPRHLRRQRLSSQRRRAEPEPLVLERGSERVAFGPGARSRSRIQRRRCRPSRRQVRRRELADGTPASVRRRPRRLDGRPDVREEQAGRGPEPPLVPQRPGPRIPRLHRRCGIGRDRGARRGASPT